MSNPFVVALVGLIFSLGFLAYGQAYHVKGAIPVAFLLGGTTMVGGLAVGLLRLLTSRRDRP